MSLILNIDTALDIASICLAKDGEAIQIFINENKKEDGAWLHRSVNEILQKNNFTIKELDAVAVSIGPGSYTGLRAGLSAAKGLCYALNIPLIAVGTLEMIAFSVKNEAKEFICPAIDARRMEIFTAVYDKSLQEKILPQAMIVDENSFAEILISSKILFCGNGSKKLQSLINNPHAAFNNNPVNASHLCQLSYERFREKEFLGLAYSEPLYIKEFYSPARKS